MARSSSLTVRGCQPDARSSPRVAGRPAAGGGRSSGPRRASGDGGDGSDGQRGTRPSTRQPVGQAAAPVGARCDVDPRAARRVGPAPAPAPPVARRSGRRAPGATPQAKWSHESLVRSRSPARRAACAGRGRARRGRAADVVGSEHPRAVSRPRRSRGRGRAATLVLVRVHGRRLGAARTRPQVRLVDAGDEPVAQGERADSDPRPRRRLSPGPAAREVARDDDGARGLPGGRRDSARPVAGTTWRSRRQPSSTASGSQSNSSAAPASSSVSALGQRGHQRVAASASRAAACGRRR